MRFYKRLGAITLTQRRKKLKGENELEQMRQMIENLKARRITATGGLSRKDKERLLDIIARIGYAKDEAEILNLRLDDLLRECIEFMKSKNH